MLSLPVLQPDLHPPSPPARPTERLGTRQPICSLISPRRDAAGVTLCFTRSRMENAQTERDGETARWPRHTCDGTAVMARWGQTAHLCTCGIRSRCWSLPQRAEPHLSGGNGDREDRRVRNADSILQDMEHSGHQARTRRLHEPTHWISLNSIWNPFLAPPPNTPIPIASPEVLVDLAGPEAEEPKPPGSGHLSQHRPRWTWHLPGPSYQASPAMSPPQESCYPKHDFVNYNIK